MQEVIFKDLGTQPYKEIWDYQEQLLKQNVDIKAANRELDNEDLKANTTNHLLFVEHLPVYTLGKNGNEENVLISANELFKQKIDYFHINRGGDITFHGPEQLVGYPILDLDNFKTDLG
jgi:lipoyl(octanoyl) transferase